MSKLILYNFWRSSCSWRVRAVLEYKNIPYEYRSIDILKKENLGEDYLKVNPVGFIPALVVNSENGKPKTLIESLAIIDYLEQICPKPSVYPSDPIERADVQAISQILVGGIQPLQNLRVMYKASEYAKDPVIAKQWSAYWIEQKFTELEKILRKTSNGGCYSVGEKLTLADICLVPQVYNTARFNVDPGNYPTIKQIYDHLLKHEDSIRNTSPELLPEFRPEPVTITNW